MRATQLAAVLVGGAMAGGCASITGTSNQSVSVQAREQGGTEVTGAACELSNNKGKWFVTTPGSVMVHKSNDDMQVLCNKAGLEPGRAAVVSDTKGSMFGNIIFGGGIGAIIDHNNGSAYEYPNFIQVVMGVFTKIEPPKPPADAATAANQSAPAAAGAPTAASQPAVSPPTTTPTAAPAPASTPATLEARLAELKRLRDAGLITPDVHAERQRQLLEAQR